MEFSTIDIQNMEQRYRARFINSLSGFKSVGLVGTVDSKGLDNLAIFSSAFHLGADPALLGLIVRPDSVPRHTLSNILDVGEYSFNHIHKSFIKKAHQCSARYDKLESEFDMVGLNREYKNGMKAPFVKESQLKLYLKYREHHELKINGTILIIGEVLYVKFSEDYLREDGSIDIEKAQSVTTSGLDTYHSTSQVMRLSYAKPDKELKEL